MSTSEITKNSTHVYSHRLTIIFNSSIKSGKFPNTLKYTDITPVFKKEDLTDECNNKPITLSHFSKVFEKLIYNHVNSYMEPKLSKYLVAFRRNHNTQHAFLKIIEPWSAILK